MTTAARPCFALGGLVLAATLVGITGCKSNPDEVRKTCETRKSWQHTVARKCTNCIAKASTEKCNAKCTDKEYSGRCASEHKAMRDEPTCEGVPACVLLCKDDDCDCIEQCYAGKPACQKIAASLDVCTTQVCDAYCR